MQVIAAAGSDEKCKLAVQRGAQSSVNYSQNSLKEAVRKLVGSGGVNVVIDTVGGDIFLEALGRYVKWSSQSGWAWGSEDTFPALCLPLALLLFVFAAHFSCRHQREQLSGWVKRNGSRGKIRKCLI